jgi:hypothetical protein
MRQKIAHYAQEKLLMDSSSFDRQHFLYFLTLPQWHGSLRPGLMCTSLLLADAAAENIPGHLSGLSCYCMCAADATSGNSQAGGRIVVAVLWPGEYAQSGAGHE